MQSQDPEPDPGLSQLATGVWFWVSSNGTAAHLHSPVLWAQLGVPPLALLLDPDPPWLVEPPLDAEALLAPEPLLDPPPPEVTHVAFLHVSPALHVPFG